MQGYSVSATVLLTPLFFGLAHLHHLREHVVHQGHPLRLAAAMVRRRMCFLLCVWKAVQADTCAGWEAVALVDLHGLHAC